MCQEHEYLYNVNPKNNSWPAVAESLTQLGDTSRFVLLSPPPSNGKATRRSIPRRRRVEIVKTLVKNETRKRAMPCVDFIFPSGQGFGLNLQQTVLHPGDKYLRCGSGNSFKNLVFF